MARLRSLSWLGLLWLGLLAGCGGDSAPAPSGPASAPPPTSTAAADLVLELRGDGLVADDELVFRTATRAQVLADVEAALGPSTGSYAVDCPLGSGTATEHDGLVLLFAGEEFVGWAERGSPERDLPTAEGVRLQSSVADVRAALPGTRITGRTFTSPVGLSGRFDGDGRVSELRGGASCDPR